MSFISNLLGLGDVVRSVGGVADELITSDEERIELKNTLEKTRMNHEYLMGKLGVDQNLAQIEVNKEDAKSGKFFQSGWRPAIGWIGAASMTYQYILYPLLLWVATFKPELVPPAPLPSEMLYTMLTGMLGIAGLRSVDKMKGLDTK